MPRTLKLHEEFVRVILGVGVSDIIVRRVVVQAEAQAGEHLLSREGTGLLNLYSLSAFELTEAPASLYDLVT